MFHTSHPGHASACRVALSHAVLGAHLSTQSSSLLLDVYRKGLRPDDLALAMSQLAMSVGERSGPSHVTPLLQCTSHRLPYGTQFWGPTAGHICLNTMVRQTG